jgi:hypothetical protein
MDPIIVAAIIGAGAAVVAAIIGRQSGRKKGREEGREKGRGEKEQEIDDAPRKYVEHLDKLIRDAVHQGREKAVLNARAIVSIRNDLRGSMMRISELLNSDIDRLSREIGEPIGREVDQQPQRANPDTIYETIQVLEKKWPSKKDQVEINLRKVLAELGILGQSPNRPRQKKDK